MIYFVILVLVNALALTITVILTPNLNIQSLLPGVVGISLTYLIIGILIGLINAFVRPLLLLFTARLLVRHMVPFTIVINTFLFMPFTVQIARLVERFVPDRPRAVPERARPLHLDDVYLDTPALALDRLRLEIGHLGDLVLDVLRSAGAGMVSGDRLKMIRGVREVELLHAEMLSYARRISQAEIGSHAKRRRALRRI